MLEEMKFKEVVFFIKFVLGENVKQLNWGEDYCICFLQICMGVEQVYVDKFMQAVVYGEKVVLGVFYCCDFDLEMLLEIVNGECFIICYFYW